MGTGKIIRFDMDKGYGFIAQDNGGDDVFLHVNELVNVGSQIDAGTRLRFSIMDGARGLKAYGVQVIEDYHSGEEGTDGGPAENGGNGHAVTDGQAVGDGQTVGDGQAASDGRSGAYGAVTGHGSTDGAVNGSAAGNGSAAAGIVSPANVAAVVSSGTAAGAIPAQGAAPARERIPARKRTGAGENSGEVGEVFSEEEFTRRITDLILESVPQLTGAQIVELRGHMLEFARGNAWVG